MRRLPPEPQVGDRITAELVRELIRCIRERQLLKGPNYTLQTTPNGTYLKIDPPKRQIFPREPLPYEVRWAQSENDGEGAWVIWLPYMPTSTTSIPAFGPLLMVGNEYVDFLQGTAALSPAQTLPSGWFILRNDAEGGAVYMNILVPTHWSAAGYVVAGIETTPDSTPAGEDDYTHYSVLIATMTTNEDTGAKRVKQAVDSTITVEGPNSGSGGGGDDEESAHPLPYEVRWDANLGSGAWKIYLPTNDLLFYDGQYIATSAMTGISPISDGWYSLSAVSSSSAKVYLVITDTPGQSSSTIAAAFADTPGQASTGSEVINIRIADISYNSQDDSTAVGQSVVGALHLGGNVIYLDDVTWDASSHQLTKQWVRHNTVTGNDTILTTAPSGKTATISTTPISSIIGS